MTSNRVNIKQYDGNELYLGAGMNQYCWSCKAHRAPGGGGPMGKLKLWHCAECKARKADKKTITAGNGTTKESNDGK